MVTFLSDPFKVIEINWLLLKKNPPPTKPHFKLWFRKNMPFQASHCPGFCNAQHKSRLKLVMSVLGNVLNILSFGDQGD